MNRRSWYHVAESREGMLHVEARKSEHSPARAAQSRRAPTAHPLKEKTMDRKPLYAALIAAAFALPVAATANSGAKHTGDKAGVNATTSSGQASFSSLDTNGDGYISKDELAAASNSADLKKLDTNGDGKVSRAEYSAMGSGSASASTGTSANATAPS